MPAYLPLLLSALAFIFVIISFFYFRADIRVRTSQERFLAELREEVNSILKSINETTDRDISLIEEREKNLKALLSDIEKRLKVYIREVEVHRGAEEAYRELGKNRFRLPKDSHGEAAQQEKPHDSEEPATVNPAFPIPEFKVKSPISQGEPRENPPSVGEQVLSLARAGFSVPVIASRLGISIAEVEFAAAILERRDAN